MWSNILLGSNKIINILKNKYNIGTVDAIYFLL